jgi:hypothetical protein
VLLARQQLPRLLQLKIVIKIFIYSAILTPTHAFETDERGPFVYFSLFVVGKVDRDELA